MWDNLLIILFNLVWHLIHCTAKHSNKGPRWRCGVPSLQLNSDHIEQRNQSCYTGSIDHLLTSSPKTLITWMQVLTLPLSISSVAAAAQLVVQSEHQVSLLDPLTGVLKPLASFGEDWTNEAGSTGLGCNASHCISIGSWSMSPHCIGIFEKADPTNIHAVPLVGTTSGFSAPAFIESAREWQVLDLAGTLYRIDDALTLHKIAKATAFDPAQPYYYHAAPVPRDIGNDTMWCALSSASEPQGQVEGCFNASNEGCQMVTALSIFAASTRMSGRSRNRMLSLFGVRN